MTEAEIQARLDEIRSLDSESAHYEEDRLHRDVLHAIAHGAEDADTLAELALQSVDIDFTRWYA